MEAIRLRTAPASGLELSEDITDRSRPRPRPCTPISNESAPHEAGKVNLMPLASSVSRVCGFDTFFLTRLTMIRH
jgi:hypothetical protein